MQRFYFHTQDGKPVRDGQGVELADLQEARLEAVGLIAQMLRDHPQEFWDTENLSVTVTDDTGLTYFSILVSAVISPAAGPVERPAGL